MFRFDVKLMQRVCCDHYIYRIESIIMTNIYIVFFVKKKKKLKSFTDDNLKKCTEISTVRKNNNLIEKEAQ